MLPRKQLYLLSLAGMLLIALVLANFTRQQHQEQVSHADRAMTVPVRFVDEARVVPPIITPRFDQELEAVNREMGVDLRFLLIKSTGGESIEQFAVELARSMGVGANVGERGILCVYDVDGQRMRIEVGPKLEGVLTDAFTGYVERQNLKAYASTGHIARGMQITMMLIVTRLRAAALGMDYDPRLAEKIENKQLLAEGAGATATVGADAPGEDVVNTPSTPEARERYSPQPTVADAYVRYMDWLTDPAMYVDVPLFTPETQGYLKHYTISRAYHDYIVLDEYGQSYTIKQQGDLAMVVYTSTPFASPWYFRHTSDGWVMDMMAAIRNSRELLGMPYTWSWTYSGDEYSKAFGDQVIQVGRVYRIRNGDNRALPVNIEFK